MVSEPEGGGVVRLGIAAIRGLAVGAAAVLVVLALASDRVGVWAAILGLLAAVVLEVLIAMVESSEGGEPDPAEAEPDLAAPSAEPEPEEGAASVAAPVQAAAPSEEPAPLDEMTESIESIETAEPGGFEWDAGVFLLGARPLAPQCPRCGRFDVRRSLVPDTAQCPTCGAVWARRPGQAAPLTVGDPSARPGSGEMEPTSDGEMDQAPPRLRLRGLWLPKAGSSEEEWEDGFAYDETTGRFAIADGASSAVASGGWAAALSHSYVDGGFDVTSRESFASWLATVQAKWRPPVAAEPAGSGDDESWWVDAVTGQPTWATLVVGGAVRSDSGEWQVVLGAVGDSCAFHLRDGRILGQLPALGPDDFDSYPELVGTASDSIPRAAQSYVSTVLAAQDGDLILLASDALAEWALREAQQRPEVWALLCGIDNRGLSELAGELRNAGQLVNDDVTLLRCVLGPD